MSSVKWGSGHRSPLLSPADFVSVKNHGTGPFRTLCSPGEKPIKNVFQGLLRAGFSSRHISRSVQFLLPCLLCSDGILPNTQVAEKSLEGTIGRWESTGENVPQAPVGGDPQTARGSAILVLVARTKGDGPE